MKKWTAIVVCLVAGSFAGSFALGPVLLGKANNAESSVIPRDLVTFRHVVKKVLPAVVSIDAERTVARKKVTRMPQIQPRQNPGFADERIPPEFRKFFEEFGRKPFEGFKDFDIPERSRKSFGSGFIVDPDGVVMTNYHVVAGASKVVVTLHDGKKYTSKDIRKDRKTDLAIIKLDTKGTKLPHLQLGDSDAMQIGDRVLAVGAPFGLTGSVTHGIVSAKGRNGLHMNMYEDFIQTDAAINPGNSGGPLVNLEGKVIGINAAIKTRSGGFNGVGLAVASNLAKSVKRALLKDGVVHRGYLGVQVAELDPQVRARMGLQKDVGVVVGKVFKDTPAAKAGFKAGDVIAKVNGKTINDGRELQHIIAHLPLKQATNVEIVRDGKHQDLSVTIEEQPDEFGTATVPVPQTPQKDKEQSTSIDRIGVEVQDLTPRLAKQFGYDEDTSGVVISNVQRGSLASRAGLTRGVVILKVDNQPVANAGAAREAFDKASVERGVLLQVRTPRGGTNYVLLQSGANQ